MALAGHSVENFIDVPSTSIVCKICREVVAKAVSAPCCPTDVYCRDCLEKWLENRQQCPSDQTYLDHAMLKLRSDVDAEIQQLVISCTHKSHGCRWTGALASWTMHSRSCIHASYDLDNNNQDDVADEEGASSSDNGFTDSQGTGDPNEPDATMFPSSFPRHKLPRTSFVGIMNQGATCYLNSLLQSLYMTPEFRNAVYRWDPAANKGKAAGDTSETIPYQLARLFALLQTSTNRAISTKPLTRSFGWDRGEAFEQHDVQELCRVLFDSLESYWRDTGLASVISDLYEGELKDSVKCKACGHESARYDKYLDIPLVIKGFGASKAVASVQEALQSFTETELLEGENQYYCSKCQKKTDADKGLKFCSFPYILSLQLKRFDFDYTTMRRIKLNDRVSFPCRLNLNGLVDKDDAHAKAAMERRFPSATSSKDLSSGPEEAPASGKAEQAGTEGQAAEAAEAAAATSNPTHPSPPTGPYVYDLFSIMIQSGSALGGHYYAYIKYGGKDIKRRL